MKELNFDQMENIQGGEVTTREEYCATLKMIAEHNKLDDDAKRGWEIGAFYAGCYELWA